MEKRISDIVSQAFIEMWRNVERFVAAFYLINPKVKILQSLVNQVIKRILFINQRMNLYHQDGEESKSQKLQNHAEDIFLGCASGVISIAYSSKSHYREVERGDIEMPFIFHSEVVCFIVDPTSNFVLSSYIKPKTSKDVGTSHCENHKFERIYKVLQLLLIYSSLLHDQVSEEVQRL